MIFKVTWLVSDGVNPAVHIFGLHLPADEAPSHRAAFLSLLWRVVSGPEAFPEFAQRKAAPSMGSPALPSYLLILPLKSPPRAGQVLERA